MKVIEWLFAIENRTVWVTGSNSLMDLRIAIIGFLEAERFSGKGCNDPFYPGFQMYVQGVYGIAQTDRSWARIITENSENPDMAMKSFYKLLREYAAQNNLYVQ